MNSGDLALLRSTYLYQPGRHRPLADSARCWDKPVQELLQAGYSFLPEQYGYEGYLFRGLKGQAAPVDNAIGHTCDDGEMSRVERSMGVYFLTHEISDAITASALYENINSAIIIIRAGYFNRQLQACKAATLAIGDAGFVFRYPFVTAPISINDIEYIITTAGHSDFSKNRAIQEKYVMLPAENRQSLTQAINEFMEQRGIIPARPEKSERYPR